MATLLYNDSSLFVESKKGRLRLRLARYKGASLRSQNAKYFNFFLLVSKLTIHRKSQKNVKFFTFCPYPLATHASPAGQEV